MFKPTILPPQKPRDVTAPNYAMPPSDAMPADNPAERWEDRVGSDLETIGMSLKRLDQKLEDEPRPQPESETEAKLDTKPELESEE